MSLSYVVAQRLVTRRAGGRRVALEILHNTTGIANLVRTGAWHQLYTQLETGQKDGMITLERHLHSLVVSGEITPQEARNSANDPQALERLLQPQ